MKLAIPVWHERVSPLLDTASRLLIVQIDGTSQVLRSETHLDGLNLTGRCFRMHGLGIDVLICGAISRPFSRSLRSAGITVIEGIAGLLDDVLEAYLKGTLLDSDFFMPGCKRRKFSRHSSASGSGIDFLPEHRRRRRGKNRKF